MLAKKHRWQGLATRAFKLKKCVKTIGVAQPPVQHRPTASNLKGNCPENAAPTDTGVRLDLNFNQFPLAQPATALIR